MGAYLSARESAAYCGVSEKTIRNWIASGRLSAEKSAGAFRIDRDQLDELRSGSPHRPQGAASASAEVRAEGGPQGADAALAAGLAGFAAVIDRLTIENRQLAESAAMWQERARVLGEQLALQAPAQSAVAARIAPEPPETPTGAPSPFPWPMPPSPNVRPLVVALCGLVVLAVLLVAGVLLLVVW